MLFLLFFIFPILYSELYKIIEYFIYYFENFVLVTLYKPMIMALTFRGVNTMNKMENKPAETILLKYTEGHKV